MAFTDLTPELQNIIMLNFEFFAKLVLIGGFFILSLFYIFKVYNKQPTPYLLISIIRFIAYCVSWVYLFFSPTYILFLYPQISLELILRILFSGLLVAGFVLFMFFLVNLLYYSPFYLLKKAGFDVSTKGQNKVLVKIDKLLGYYK